MATLGEMKQYIAKRLFDVNGTAVSSDDITLAINDSIRFWKNSPFYFNQKRVTVFFDYVDEDDPTQGIDPFLPMPQNILYLLKDGGLVINYSQQRYEILPVSNADFERANVEGRGLPYIYTVRPSNRYEVYYQPDQIYQVEVNYVADYADLTSDAQSNDFTTFGENLIRNDALARLHAELRQDEKMAAIFAQRAREEANSLSKRGSYIKRTGNLSTYF